MMRRKSCRAEQFGRRRRPRVKFSLRGETSHFSLTRTFLHVLLLRSLSLFLQLFLSIMPESKIPQPGPAKLKRNAGPDEWLEAAKDCKYLSEPHMKQLCEIVKEYMMEGKCYST